MNPELHQQLREAIARGEITKEEMLALFPSATTAAPSGPSSQQSPAETLREKLTITRVLYYVGGLIVLIGLGVYIAQFWQDLGSFGRILVTFGVFVALYIAGAVLWRRHEGSTEVSMVFHSLAGLLLPGGITVMLIEFFGYSESPWTGTLIFGTSAVFYALTLSVFRHVIFTFFTFLFGTIALYTTAEALLPGAFYQHEDFYAYLTMAVGVGYLFLSRAFRGTFNEQLCGVLTAFGSLGLLGATFSRVFDSVLWQLLFFGMVAGGLFLAVSMRSKAMLVFSTLFLIAHLVYITGEYFADSIGWPISLVILGFLVIGIGYGSVRLNKEYISESASE